MLGGFHVNFLFQVRRQFSGTLKGLSLSLNSSVCDLKENKLRKHWICFFMNISKSIRTEYYSNNEMIF